MAQDLTPKLVSIGGDSSVRAKSLLQALEGLVTNAEILTQSGGNFPDGVFDSTNLSYLTAYNVNVFLQIVVPAINDFLDTHVQDNPGLMTYRQALQTMVSGPY
jgi:hypothetical protein